MSTYDFECADCGEIWSQRYNIPLQTVSRESLVAACECPKCGEQHGDFAKLNAQRLTPLMEEEPMAKSASIMPVAGTGRPVMMSDPFTSVPNGPQSIGAAIVESRESTYGSFSDNAEIAQGIKRLLCNGPAYPRTSNAQREALDLIAIKLARIVCGDPHYDDNWDDLSGYAVLGQRFKAPKG